MIVGRMILFVLKSLMKFNKKKYISRSLVSVLGPELTDAFFHDFCTYAGTADGFDNRSFTCDLRPSGTIMPGLSLHDNLQFTFTHHDIYGETEYALARRITSCANREVPI